MWRCLIPRLPKEYDQHFDNLVKGHEGEQKFAGYLECLSNDWLILFDLLLEYNYTIFQIDALLISPKTLYLFDVKNHEGDYFIDSGKWYTKKGKEIRDPILQLNRCEFLLRQLLQEYGLKTPIKGNVVFVNTEFTLYQAPLNLPIILPTQINRLIKQLNMDASKPDNRHIRIAEKLASIHLNDSPFNRFPDYDYKQLKKGIICAACSSFASSLKSNRVVCGSCGTEEPVDSAVVRTIKEFVTLFPVEKITTNRMHEWCGGILPHKTIRRVLGKNFILKGGGKSAHYINS